MSESDLQMNVINYIKMQYPKTRYCASLGGIRTTIIQAKIAKRTGYVKGFPDLQITEARHNYHGLFIELKTFKGRATIFQKDWINALNKRNYRAVICKGFNECKKELDWYLG
tara:strand:+ start:1690 stop:2025 length:336 start_codon:yes stop_codon:yes gene_type:complete